MNSENLVVNENREKPYFFKRIVAYLIDLIIVMLLAGIISNIFVNNDNYKNETQKLLELTRDYSEGKITKDEYTKESENVNYYLTKDSIGVTIINCSVAIVYYVIMCFYCGGITLGKYIMKLRIVSANDKRLNIGHFLLRSLFVNLILSNILSILMVLCLNKDTFIKVSSKVSSALVIFLLATLVFIMYREDGRGLHDLIANTKIISTKDEKKRQDNSDIKEAKIIEEKKSKKEKGSKKERVDKK